MADDGRIAMAWAVNCPARHECDFLVFHDPQEAEVQAEQWNEDHDEGENPHKVVPLYPAPSPTEAITAAQVEVWKRKAEAYDVLVECCERLSTHQDDGSPLVEALLDAVIEAKRLREFGAGSPQPHKSKAEEKSGGG